LQLIIDPACSIVFEAEQEEADIMQRPPRPRDASLFDRKTVALGVMQGLILLAVLLAIYGAALSLSLGTETARTLTFTTMVIANLGLIFANRTRSWNMRTMFVSHNPALWWATIGTSLLLTLVMYVPVLRNLFYFAPLDRNSIIVVLIADLACVMAFALAKRALRPTYPNSGIRRPD
jgi:Ca2+-transporting ATPase